MPIRLIPSRRAAAHAAGWLCGLALAVAAATVALAPPATAAATHVRDRATSVHVFVPATFRAVAVETGSCWVGSIATNRRDAYRCMTGNAIHDPCFAFGQGTAVECPTDPADGEAVWIALTKPLPTPNPTLKAGTAIRPWWGVLAGGGRCGVMTGTTVFGRAFSCGLPERGGRLTPIYCTWPAPSKADPGLYVARCATATVGAHGPQLGAERTYDLAALWF